MTITGSQTSAALPAASQAATATATAAGAAPAGGFPHTLPPYMPPGPEIVPMWPIVRDPFAELRRALEDLLRSIELLGRPPVGRPPYTPYPPYPPFEPPHVGCPHMPTPPIEPPILPPTPPVPPVSKPRPEVGDVAATAYVGKSLRKSEIKVTAVHGTYADRSKAVAAARHLAGIHGNKPYGVMVTGQPDKPRYVVVALSKNANLTPQLVGNVMSRSTGGWSLDTVAFDAKTARRITAHDLEGVPLPPPIPAHGASTTAHDDTSVPAPQPHSH